MRILLLATLLLLASFIIRAQIPNTVGKLVRAENLKNISNDECQISLHALPAGIYTFRLQTSAGVIVKQIIRL